jgi:hypothetical protein
VINRWKETFIVLVLDDRGGVLGKKSLYIIPPSVAENAKTYWEQFYVLEPKIVNQDTEITQNIIHDMEYWSAVEDGLHEKMFSPDRYKMKLSPSQGDNDDAGKPLEDRHFAFTTEFEREQWIQTIEGLSSGEEDG